MRYLFLVAVVAFGTSCRSERPAEAKNESKPAARSDASLVRLTPEGQKLAGISVEPVTTRGVGEAVQATGRMAWNEDRTWRVGSVVAGRVVAISVRIGDTARAGQVLAKLHTHEVHDARAAYDKAVAELKRAQSDEAQARRVRDRARRLLELKATSQEQAEAAEAGLRGAQSAVAAAQAEIEKERVHLVDFLQVPLDETSHDQDYVPIKAPATGVVIERKVNEGAAVSAGELAFILADTSSLWMLAAFNEADIASLHAGQQVRVSVRAYPERTFTGRILRLGEQLDPTTRTLNVRVLVPNPGGLLKPEMYGTAEISRGVGREGIFIPDSAIQDVGGHQVVFVRRSASEFEVRPIDTSPGPAGQVEVRSGLRAGEQIATRGSFVLKSELLKNSLEEE